MFLEYFISGDLVLLIASFRMYRSILFPGWSRYSQVSRCFWRLFYITLLLLFLFTPITVRLTVLALTRLGQMLLLAVDFGVGPIILIAVRIRVLRGRITRLAVLAFDGSILMFPVATNVTAGTAHVVVTGVTLVTNSISTLRAEATILGMTVLAVS